MAVDFGLLPPEVNSTRIYSGPGSAPLLAAATAWDAVAAELYSTAAHFSLTMSDLATTWRGPVAATMTAAVTPYQAWIGATAERAEQTAHQARSAATAFETAFAATVPPAEVTSNRVRLAALVAANLLGQNTPAIMATQAEYIEMWAQDAAVMYGYADTSAAASTVTPFRPAPQITNPAGTAAQDEAVGQATASAAGASTTQLPQAMSAVPATLQALAAPTAVPAADATASAINGFITGPLSPLSLYTIPGVPYLLGIQSFLLPRAGQNLATATENLARAQANAAADAPATLRPPVTAASGGGGVISGLSVPRGWGAAAPEVRMVARTLAQNSFACNSPVPAANVSQAAFGDMPCAGLPRPAVAATPMDDARGVRRSLIASEEATTANIFVIHEAPAVPVPESVSITR